MMISSKGISGAWKAPVLGVMLAGAMFVTTGTAQASASLVSAPQATQSSELSGSSSVQGAAAPTALQVLQPYVHATDLGYVIDAPASVLATVNPTSLGELRAYHASVAEFLAEGSLQLVSGNYVSSGASVANLTAVSPAASGAHGYVISRWYGLEVGIDSWLADKISAGMGAVGVATAIGGGPYGAPVAIILAAGFVIIQACTHQNGWSYIYWVGMLPPFGQPVCNPFG